MHLPDTDPYPWPYDGNIDGSRLALVIVAAQHHWVGQSIDVAGVVSAIETASAAVRSVGGRVVMTRHGIGPVIGDAVRNLRPHLPETTSAGWGLVLEPDDQTLVCDARGLNAFFGSSLDADLRADGRDHLLFAGFAAEVMVDTTLRGANDRGYECLVLTDAYAPLERSTGDRALSSVTMSGGIFGALGTTSALVGALASGPTNPNLSGSQIEPAGPQIEEVLR